jgi:hypothetical protein
MGERKLFGLRARTLRVKGGNDGHALRRRLQHQLASITWCRVA